MPVQPTFDDRDETYVVSLTNEGGAEKMKVRKYEWDFQSLSVANNYTALAQVTVYRCKRQKQCELKKNSCWRFKDLGNNANFID